MPELDAARRVANTAAGDVPLRETGVGVLQIRARGVERGRRQGRAMAAGERQGVGDVFARVAGERRS